MNHMDICVVAYILTTALPKPSLSNDKHYIFFDLEWEISIALSCVSLFYSLNGPLWIFFSDLDNRQIFDWMSMAYKLMMSSTYIFDIKK